MDGTVKKSKKSGSKSDAMLLKRAQKRIRASATQGAPAIELYQAEDCPYSHSVRKCLSMLGLDYVAHSVSHGLALTHQDLVKRGGKDEIPFLIDHATGTQLYDSDAIIRYLEKQYSTEKPETGVEGFKQNLMKKLETGAERMRWRWSGRAEKVRDFGKELQESKESLKQATKLVREITGSVLESARGRFRGKPSGNESSNSSSSSPSSQSSDSERTDAVA